MENIKLIYIASFIALLVLIYAAIKVYKSIFLNSNKQEKKMNSEGEKKSDTDDIYPMW